MQMITEQVFYGSSRTEYLLRDTVHNKPFYFYVKIFQNIWEAKGDNELKQPNQKDEKLEFGRGLNLFKSQIQKLPEIYTLNHWTKLQDKAADLMDE